MNICFLCFSISDNVRKKIEIRFLSKTKANIHLTHILSLFCTSGPEEGLK